MAFVPISGTAVQYMRTAAGVAASDFFLKFFDADAPTTPINMATDDTGGTLLAKARLNSEGYIRTEASETSIFIPHIDRAYLIKLFPTEADADANTNAVWSPAAIDPFVVSTGGQFDAYDATFDYPIRGIALASDNEFYESRVTPNIGNDPAGNLDLVRWKQIKFRDTADIRDFVAVVDGVTDNTINLNQALAVGGYIFWPKESAAYIISDELVFVSNTVIEFEAGVEIKILNAGDAINTTGKSVLRMDEVDNVVIHGNGLVITGVRTGTGTDNVNKAVGITGSTGIRVFDVHAVDMAGDGFVVAEALDNTPIFSEDVIISRCTTTNVMRNGYSIISAKNLWITDSTSSSANGKAPETGFNVEPGGGSTLLQNINVINCCGNDNKAVQFGIVAGGNATPVTNYVDIKLVNCTAKDSLTFVESIGFAILNNKPAMNSDGSIEVIHCRSINLNNFGMFIRNIDKNGQAVRVEDFTIVDCAQTAASNLIDPSTLVVLNDGPFVLQNNNGTEFPDPGNVYIDGLRIKDKTRDRAPFEINANAGNPWVDVQLRELDWENTVGETTIPFIQASSDTIVEKLGQPFQFNRTANTTLGQRFSNFEVTNIGATGTLIYTLDPLTDFAITAKLTLIGRVAQTIRIQPNAADVIQPFGTTVGKFVEFTGVGVIVTLRPLGTGLWGMDINDDSTVVAEA